MTWINDFIQISFFFVSRWISTWEVVHGWMQPIITTTMPSPSPSGKDKCRWHTRKEKGWKSNTPRRRILSTRFVECLIPKLIDTHTFPLLKKIGIATRKKNMIQMEWTTSRCSDPLTCRSLIEVVMILEIYTFWKPFLWRWREGQKTILWIWILST